MTKTSPPQYKSALFQFMSFIDGVQYSVKDEDVEFSCDRLLQITDRDVERYFNFKAYGTEDLGEGDNPTLCRANTLFFHKKALSYFMPRKKPDWDDILQQGNPTKSLAANNVISRLKLHEVHGTGVATSARRPFEFDEYLNVLVATRCVFLPDR
jgi:hypothetical protein